MTSLIKNLLCVLRDNGYNPKFVQAENDLVDDCIRITDKISITINEDGTYDVCKELEDETFQFSGATRRIETLLKDLSRYIIDQDKFRNGLNTHQIGITHNFAQVVTLLSGENHYLTFPVKGVLIISEQGTDLSILTAVFLKMETDGTLGAPVNVKNPIFTNSPFVLK